jgi:hypothetical protein
LRKLGFVPHLRTPREFVDVLRDENAKWPKITAAGIEKQ